MTDPQTGLSFSQSNITVSLGFADTDNIPVFASLAYLQMIVPSEKHMVNGLLLSAAQLEIL